MNLLLILSALLSALTGAMGTRVPEVRLHQTATTVRAAAQIAPARVVSLRPEAALPRLAVIAGRPIASFLVLAEPVPAYAMRRRE